MSRVIQIRDVPDDVHDALRAAAAARGLSLTRFMLDELEHLAQRTQIARENAAVVRRTRAGIHRKVGREEIISAIDEGRRE